MGISTKETDTNTLEISINGTLGNALHKEFRAAYDECQLKNYVVDLAKTDNIDSSGLGMLLLLKDHAGGEDANIEIINCSSHILDIFHVTSFYRLFKIPDYNNRGT